MTKFCLALLFASVSAHAQSAVPFLQVSPDARSSAMGGTGTGVASDASAMYWNVGGLAFQKGTDVLVTYSEWLPQFGAEGLTYGNVFGARYIPELGGTFGLNLTWLNLGQFEVMCASDNCGGAFHSFEYAITGSYGTQLSNDLGIGIQLRYIYSSLAPVGTAQEQGKGIGQSYSGDIGVLWRPDTLVLFDAVDLSKMLSIGVTLKNVGPKITYADAAQADPLPTQLRLGIGVTALNNDFNSLKFSADVSKILVHTNSDLTTDALPKSLITSWNDPNDSTSLLETMEYSIGTEYVINNMYSLRAGYYYESPNIGGRRYMTLGAGLKYKIFSLDYCVIEPSFLHLFQKDDPLANTMWFTLGLHLQ